MGEDHDIPQRQERDLHTVVFLFPVLRIEHHVCFLHFNRNQAVSDFFS